MTLEFEHENDPLPCCPYCGMYDNEIFTKVENLLFGSYVCFHHECPGCEARYAVRFYPPRHTGFNTGFLENERHAFKDADPQKPADQGEGIDRPSTVKSSDVSTARVFDRARAIELAAWAIAHHSDDADRYGLYWGSGMAAVDDMPDALKDTPKTGMSEPLSVSTPGDDSANAAEGTQSREAEHALRQAHILICWTWQSYAIRNGVKTRGWWHVKDLNPSVRVMMGSAEQGLYDALMETPD